VLRPGRHIDRVQKVAFENVKAMKFADVDIVGFFRDGRSGRSGCVCAPWRGVREVLEKDTLTTANIKDL
jgi:hypothetical protein